jgi:hypothetical protein
MCDAGKPGVYAPDKIPGGLCCGYRVVSTTDAEGDLVCGEREIVEAEAEVVRRIFRHNRWFHGSGNSCGTQSGGRTGAEGRLLECLDDQRLEKTRQRNPEAAPVRWPAGLESTALRQES